jgi:pSer/pThr/pTyr-binding forkhead associated (FHA) protein
LRQTPFRIGRAAGNELVLADPTVSRSHALIHFTGGSYVLEDQGGRGSTYVNGQCVLQVTLCPGDRIRLGDVEFVLRRR